MKQFGSRKILVALVILINTFLWYYLTLKVIATISNVFSVQQAWLLSFYSLGVLLGEIIGLFFEIDFKTLFSWVVLGAITAVLPFLFPFFAFLDFHSICFAWGFSFGLGIPLCLAYFAENTLTETRGRLSGMVLLISFFCAIPLASLGELFGLQTLYAVFVIWRALGLLPILISKGELKKLKPGESKKLAVSIIQSKFYLYLVPWFIFNLVDAFEGTLLTNFLRAVFPKYIPLLQLIYLLFHGVFALLSGFLCDMVGRKPVVILGFATIGIAYAVVSVVPRSLEAWFLFVICNGLAWGSFSMVFIFLIWGDLAPKRLREKYYLIGSSPVFAVATIQPFFANYVTSLSETNAFSLAAIFLFLAVLPILFAPETLPEKTIRERELKSYIEKAKRVREKFTKG